MTKISSLLRTSMALVVPNIGGRNWGWGYGGPEDQRMHLQTMDTKAPKVQIWLETKGRRVFEVFKKGVGIKELQAYLRKPENREHVEQRWVGFMIDRGWLKFSILGNVIKIKAYPGQAQEFERKLDLEEMFPGSYATSDFAPPTEKTSKLDADSASLILRTDKEKDRQWHIELPAILWRGKA